MLQDLITKFNELIAAVAAGGSSNSGIGGFRSVTRPNNTTAYIAGDVVEVELKDALIICRVNGNVVYTHESSYLQGATIIGAMCIAAPNFAVDLLEFLYG